MTRKNIWHRYLIIGISISFITLFFSCEQESDCWVVGEFVFENKTAYTIETPRGIIQPSNKLTIKNEGLGPCEVNEKSYISPFNGGITITFNKTKCLPFKGGAKAAEGEGPVGIKNYKSSKVANLHYRFEYTFSEADYEKAIECD